MNEVNVTKTTGGLGRRLPLTDMVSGLLVSGVVGTTTIVLGTTYKLRGISDAKALGLKPSYDTANSILVYEHIKEFFRINPNGTLYLKVVSRSLTYSQLLDKDQAGTAKQLIVDSNGTINQLAVAYNPSVAVTDTTALDAAILKAQELADHLYDTFRPVHILLEGRGFDAAAVATLHDRDSENVSVMVGQNYAIANANAAFNRYGAVGTLLGAVSLARVNESIAWVDKFDMFGDNLTDWSIANTQSIAVAESKLEEINDAGFIFFRNITDKTGIYFNDSHTATAEDSDYRYIENNRTVNKATRLIRQALIGDLNSPVRVDPTSGRIPDVVIDSLEAKGKKAITDGMMNAEELSGFGFNIDPEQNILETSELEAVLDLIPTGTARNFSIKIGFINPFNS